MKPKLYIKFCFIFFIFCCFSAGSVCKAALNDIKPLKNTQKQDKIVSDIEIHINKSDKDTSYYLKMVKGLIVIKKEKLFSEKQLKESLDVLKLCNKFSEINVELEEEQGKIKVKFYLTPFKYIQNIQIKGCAPLFEKEILNIMTIYVGDVFDKKTVKEQIALIEDFYKKDGFYSPSVKIDWNQETSENYTVFINIKTGQYEKLDKLNFHGNVYSNDFRLKMKIFNVFAYFGSAGRFKESVFKKDIKKLQLFYWKKKFYDAKINYKIKKNLLKKTVDIDVYVEEGSQYETFFEGNEKFKDRTLKKELVLKTKGNLNNSGIRKSTKNIEKKYREGGYQEIKIKIREFLSNFENYKKKKVVLKITEGPCLLISEIEIKGNKKLTEKKIKEQMLIRKKPFWGLWVYNPDVVDEDLYAVLSLYLKNGFIEAKIRKEEEWDKNRLKVKLIINITEGPQTFIKSIKISVPVKKMVEKLRNAIHHKVGEPLQKYMIKNDENILSAIISEEGYPHVKASCEITINNKGHDAHLLYKIDPGYFVKMGKAYYSGNFRTKEKVLSDVIDIKEGEAFSLKGMFEGQKNIRNLGVFHSVRFKTIGLKEKKKTINLFAELEEKKPYFLQFGGGYESNRGMFLETAAGDHNFLGTAKDIAIIAEISQIGYKSKLIFKNPRFLSSNITAGLDLFREQEEKFNQNFGTRESGVSAGLRLKFQEKFTTGIDFGLKQKDTYEIDIDYENSVRSEIVEDQYEKRTVFTALPSVGYDIRDSFIRPQKGIYLFLSTKFSKGLENSLDDFMKYRFDGRYFFKLSKRVILAGLIRLGYVDSYGEYDNVPADELFFLGGVSDIRGYKENMFEYNKSGNAVGGRFSGQASIEARTYLGYNFELTMFYDAGKLSDFNDEEVTGQGDIRSSAGLGLRYITPIGPIGVMWGYKLDRRLEESSGRLHFSMGYSF